MSEGPARRNAPLDMGPDEFRALGHWLVDRIAAHLAEIRRLPVTPGESPSQVRAALGARPLPDQGEPAAAILEDAWSLVSGHSLLNGHPRFAGYVTSSAAPVGALGDLLAAAINPNSGAWILSPMASEIEAQAVAWIADFLGYPAGAGGLFVSGGNMANFIGWLAARTALAGAGVRAQGLAGAPLRAYASTETHTWIHKAADLFGHGTDAIRWVPTDTQGRMDTRALVRQIGADRAAGQHPFLLTGSAGTVSTGAVDPLPELAAIARQYGLWFHVDGAYGAPAVALPNAPCDLTGLRDADSLAIDPHKWLYAPLEAGCVLVRDPQRLRDAFDYSPAYYRFSAGAEESPVNYYAMGLQNSRGFRALKVWLGLRAAGRDGLRRMIGDEIRLARRLYELAQAHPELEAFTHSLSITTFRYVPSGAPPDASWLNELNEALLDRIQKSGELFVSNAVIHGKFVLRLCLVNFRTTEADIGAIPEIVVRLGREVRAAGPPHWAMA